MSIDTAILFFSRPDNGKQLGTSKKAHQGVWRTLHHHTRDTLAKTHLPVIEWGPALQQGHTFIERLDHALETLQSLGWQKVIIVGDDCPQLTPKTIREAATALDHGQHVIGPDHDGGAYLIGLSLTHWPQEAFKNLPWQTDQLLEALIKLLAITHPLHRLAAKQDVNTFRQWHTLWRRGSLSKELRQLLGAYLALPVRRKYLSRKTHQHQLSPTVGRGPPAIA